MTAIVCLWINVAVGVIIGFIAIDKGYPGAGLLGILWGIAYAVVAVKLAQLSAGARTAGLILSGLSIFISLASARIGISTNLIIFIALLMPSARRAVEVA